MTQPLSIAMVCFPSIGGSGVVASELASRLADRGHTVHLVSTGKPTRMSSKVRFHEVTTPSYPVFDQPPRGLAITSKLLDLARAERIDVIHAHYALPHAASAYVARSLLGDRAPAVVTSLHGTDVTTVGADPSYRAVTCATISAADAIVVPSEFLKEQAHVKLGLPRTRAIEVIANFVDTEKFAPPGQRERARLHALFGDTESNGPVFIHVSNFRAVKRVSDLLEVLARVRKKIPARLVLVGDGPDRAAAEERARTLRVSDSVKFMGARTEFVELLGNADAFWLTSECESFGVAALEAMSCGVPVFAYRVGGLAEVATPQTGRLVPALDVDAFAKAVLDALADPGALPRMGAEARAHTERHFRPGPAVERYEALYQRTLQQRGS